MVHETLPSQKITDVFSSDQINTLTERYRSVNDANLLSFFVCNPEMEIKFLKDVMKPDEVEKNLDGVDLEATYFCFSDPSEYENPGWPLRNFILLLLKLCPILNGKNIKVISIRQDVQRSLSPSLIFNIKLEGNAEMKKSEIKWTGWERNSQGKMLPKSVSMGETMDPIKLSEHFSNLNLKLMKWRLLPNLNLDILRAQKCLLFGAGTLGCAIARNLLSWGVNDITLIDYGNVSYSNPVRQCLFTHDDAVKHKSKALAAADRLREILPSVNAKGICLQIPMPGHPVAASSREKTVEDLKLIFSLIEEHDVLFLVTDSRESRWLPTMLGALLGKVNLKM